MVVGVMTLEQTAADLPRAVAASLRLPESAGGYHLHHALLSRQLIPGRFRSTEVEHRKTMPLKVPVLSPSQINAPLFAGQSLARLMPADVSAVLRDGRLRCECTSALSTRLLLSPDPPCWRCDNRAPIKYRERDTTARYDRCLQSHYIAPRATISSRMALTSTSSASKDVQALVRRCSSLSPKPTRATSSVLGKLTAVQRLEGRLSTF